MSVHTHLLVESGIHIIEVLNLEELARDHIAEFVFIAAPMNIQGGTGAPVRPLAFPKSQRTNSKHSQPGTLSHCWASTLELDRHHLERMIAQILFRVRGRRSPNRIACFVFHPLDLAVRILDAELLIG
jgi:hypothetical protein